MNARPNRSEYFRNYRKRKIRERREYQHEYRKRNKQRLNEYTKAWQKRNPEKHKVHYMRTTQTLKRKIFDAYGNKCACCGENTYEFLAVDHIHGGGNQHRKKITGRGGGGGAFYRWLRNNGFPKDDFRLLCHNCNLARAFYGKCPHENV